MASIERLNRAFVESEPGGAARILEGIAPEGVAEVLRPLPGRVASPLIERMAPNHAAAALAALEPADAVRTVSALSNRALATLLRRTPEGWAAQVMAELPRTRSTIVRLGLRYPESLVGAWMDADVDAVREGLSVADVLERARAGQLKLAGTLALVDDDRKVVGTATADALLATDPGAPVSALGAGAVASIGDRITMTEAQRPGRWAENDALAVVQPNGRYLGMLRWQTVEEYARRAEPDAERPGAGSGLMDLFSVFTGMMIELAAELIRADDAGRRQK